MTSIDTNISNYTLSELLTIVDIGDDEIDKDTVILKTNKYINKFKTKNPEFANFFREVKAQLLQYVEDLENENISDDDNNEFNTENKILVEPLESSIEGFGTMKNEAIYGAGEKQITDWYKNQVLTQNDENQPTKLLNENKKFKFLVINMTL